MRKTMHPLRIFAASPSDMATERAKVETVADNLEPLARDLGIVLDVADWRTVAPSMGRPEQVILEQLKPTEWDVFLGVLWHRFGTPPGAEDAQTQKAYAGGTEEEFKTAYRLWKRHGRPRVMMYRCTRAIPPESLDPEQFKRVKDFFAQFEAVGGEHPGLYQTFETPEAFERLLLRHLQQLLIDYGAQLKGEPVKPEVVQELAPRAPDNLPRRASFFGRDREMDVVLRALSPEDRTWGVLVDGIGGIGKTALAVEAAHRCKERGLFAAFVFVTAKQNALAPSGIREQTPAARTLEDFLNETARALGQIGIPRLAGYDKRRALIDLLREIPTLLVYDNLETLTMEEHEAVAYFLRQLPQGCKAIIASRRRGGEGAVWLRLEKLEWDAARQLIAEEARKDAGLDSKLRRAGEARWQELYDATGGSPLALSHALGLMRLRPALSFDAALEMLRGNRDATLQEFIFQEARRTLTTNDEVALRVLSFFTPSATFEAWMAVAQLSRTELETAIDHLSALSLVDVLLFEERYALHPLTRNFFRAELFTDKRRARAAGIRFANYWIVYTKKYEGEEEVLSIEAANLNAAIDWLAISALAGETVIDKDVARLLLEMGGALSPFLSFNENWDSNIKLNMAAFKAAQGLKDWNNSLIFARNLVWSFRKIGQPEGVNTWRESVRKIEQRNIKSVRVFLSYAIEDRDRVRELYKEFQEAGFNPWMDVENLRPGQDWELEVETAIKGSDFVLICLSSSSTRKQGYIQKEIKIALDVLETMPEGEVYLIPVRLDECQLPTRLSRQQWVDLFDESGLEKLIETVRIEMGRKQSE